VIDYNPIGIVLNYGIVRVPKISLTDVKLLKLCFISITKLSQRQLWFIHLTVITTLPFLCPLSTYL
jgi:hypothetical protein